ncbi:geranyl diphosphate 2-C-methyltransferase [Saccharothrix carnea]|uniref:Geranyl diphosphate 2-C-methyltransferase n=1 Tax=Saccharothrix carnea TaxID=1280637 RepID=A0A2P8I0P1_SACCR|nr:geranyl diphosphate 2-C-methyltransferase [Saccharothrix carnea]PSL52013.1 geranyl diphosphate 2-C-methyltransferase [Saccharothrix carnea]
MTTTAASSVLRTDYQRSIADYWNNEQDPVNIKLGEVDGIYHHHYGLGAYDKSVLSGPEETRDERVIAELHRLESAQADVLLDYLGPIRPEDRLLDGGSGRGGTSLMANQRFGCRVDGVTISQKQVDFANAQAARWGVADKVRFHFKNMLDTGFETGDFSAVWTNETTMYVDLFDLFGEFSRLLRHGGRYVCITGCYNDVTGGRSKAVSQIDERYTCSVHARSEYFKALTANNLVPIEVVDLTPQTIPYWELREQSSVATGVEKSFLTAYREGSFHYLLIVADRVR